VSAPLVVLGDLLLDIDVHGRAGRLAPDAPVPVLDVAGEVQRPGGAGLAATLAARSGGREVVLVAPLAEDEHARRLVAMLADAGVETVGLRDGGATTVKRRLFAQDDRPLLRMDEGGGRVTGPVPLAATRVLRAAAAVLVADYGRGVSAVPEVRDAVASLQGPVVWDPHPRGAQPVPGLALVTPNRDEAAALAGDGGAHELAAVAGRADLLRRRWRADAVAVTLGSRGALLAHGGPPVVVPPPRGADGGRIDPCGAGDCFAAAATHALADGAAPHEAVAAAVADATSFVRAGGVAQQPGRRPPAAVGGEADIGLDAALRTVARVREQGGTVVATGGCFDLLHAGHVATLRAARALGDCLVVAVNSDASVRRLKGETRPVVPEADRAQVLGALDCVDAVVVFDEDTPVPLLRRLEPAVWAKGGDYAGADLPETPVLREWGGVAVVLPYLEGRSTTGLVHRVVSAVG